MILIIIDTPLPVSYRTSTSTLSVLRDTEYLITPLHIIELDYFFPQFCYLNQTSQYVVLENYHCHLHTYIIGIRKLEVVAHITQVEYFNVRVASTGIIIAYY